MKPIPGFKGYYITAGGKVYSDRVGGEKRAVAATRAGHNYHRVVLMKNGKKTTKYIHELVQMTYGKGKDEHIRHKDGNVDNNKASNLSPGSAKENGEDRTKQGTVRNQYSKSETAQMSFNFVFTLPSKE
jgi:hypothetical protein